MDNLLAMYITRMHSSFFVYSRTNDQYCIVSLPLATMIYVKLPVSLSLMFCK